MSRNIKARKRLAELFNRGIEVRFNEDGGRIGPFVNEDGNRISPAEGEVAMWITPPSPDQREQSLRDAQAARARALLRSQRDPDSEESLTSEVFISGMSDETLLEYVVMSDLDERQQIAQREVLSREEWKNFEALQDSMRIFQEQQGDPEAEEWRDLMEADRRFGAQIEERVDELTDAARQTLGMFNRDELMRRAKEKRQEIVGSQAFMAEYEQLMMYYAIRDVDDRRMLFFDSVQEWKEQPDEVREVIVEALSQFVGDVAEAKNSSRAASGSDSSALPSEPETSESSTQKESSE